MVESTGLENRHTLIAYLGSNPYLSATLKTAVLTAVFFVSAVFLTAVIETSNWFFSSSFSKFLRTYFGFSLRSNTFNRRYFHTSHLGFK